MKIVYKYYEPDQGLEELQAELYTKASGNPATADQIRERYKQEKIDPKTVWYALTEDGKLLAYVQARDYLEVKETHIGYPWALPDCPEGVQDKLFDELLDYIKQREETMTIRANAPADRENIINFFKKRGLVEKSKGYRYEVNLKEVSKTDYTEQEFTTRVATSDDLDLLVDLIKADGRFVSQFGSDDDIANYFKTKVFKDGHTVMVFKDETLVMATAPLVLKLPREKKESLIMRFHAYRPGNEKAYKPMLISLAKECVDTGYGIEKPLSAFIGPSDGTIASILEKHNPNKKVTGIGFGPEE
ncbi:MAG: hypothetical protein ACXAEU_03565 [Candidatus Hodarchaeales archaeon]|jgi:hypothetical protein